MPPLGGDPEVDPGHPGRTMDGPWWVPNGEDTTASRPKPPAGNPGSEPLDLLECWGREKGFKVLLHGEKEEDPDQNVALRKDADRSRSIKRSFEEPPDQREAGEFIDGGLTLWNLGIEPSGINSNLIPNSEEPRRFPGPRRDA